MSQSGKINITNQGEGGEIVNILNVDCSPTLHLQKIGWNHSQFVKISLYAIYEYIFCNMARLSSLARPFNFVANFLWLTDQNKLPHTHPQSHTIAANDPIEIP